MLDVLVSNAALIGGGMAQTDTSNRFILALLAVVGAVLAVVGWYRFFS
jgi:hypothetical protein